MTSFLLRTLLSMLHCQPGVIGSVSLLPVANVVLSDVLNEPFAFVTKSRSKPEASKPAGSASSLPAGVEEVLPSRSPA